MKDSLFTAYSKLLVPVDFAIARNPWKQNGVGWPPKTMRNSSIPATVPTCSHICEAADVQLSSKWSWIFQKTNMIYPISEFRWDGFSKFPATCQNSNFTSRFLSSPSQEQCRLHFTNKERTSRLQNLSGKTCSWSKAKRERGGGRENSRNEKENVSKHEGNRRRTCGNVQMRWYQNDRKIRKERRGKGAGGGGGGYAWSWYCECWGGGCWCQGIKRLLAACCCSSWALWGWSLISQDERIFVVTELKLACFWCSALEGREEVLAEG